MLNVKFLPSIGIEPGWYIVRQEQQSFTLWSPVCYTNPWLATLELEKIDPDAAHRVFKTQLSRI